MVLENLFNAAFGWAITISPLFAITFISGALTLLTTIIYKFATDQHLMKAIRDEIKALQQEMKKEKENPKRILELQKTMWQKNMESLKHNFKPMLITFLPVILVFQWMAKTFTPYGNILWSFGWLGTYFILTLLMSIVFRKLLKVY
ncbi:MAG TPA: EMC3/TMCO1 family protein [Candidatus Nanoarchaeia archaeon]|nr:EMC3/TMCO1 family protein [Candidatus Nanoarchaeia archaeon]